MNTGYLPTSLSNWACTRTAFCKLEAESKCVLMPKESLAQASLLRVCRTGCVSRDYHVSPNPRSLRTQNIDAVQLGHLHDEPAKASLHFPQSVSVENLWLADRGNNSLPLHLRYNPEKSEVVSLPRPWTPAVSK